MNNFRFILGVDYGDTNIGLALANSSKVITPLKIIDNKNFEQALLEINKIIILNKVDLIVIGLPLTIEGTETPMAKKIKRFAKQLRIKTKKQTVFQNEYATSKESLRQAIDMGVSKKSRSKIDHISARIILKRYLE
jgi:putative Holliday junction resolvase